MPGLVPGIHALKESKTWMAGTSPAMTENCYALIFCMSASETSKLA